MGKAEVKAEAKAEAKAEVKSETKSRWRAPVSRFWGAPLYAGARVRAARMAWRWRWATPYHVGVPLVCIGRLAHTAPPLHLVTEFILQALRAHAPRKLARDDGRAAARRAIAAGARMLLLEDGLQSPALVHTLNLVVVDAALGIGNGHVMPVGPLRRAPTLDLREADALFVLAADEPHASTELICFEARERGKPVCTTEAQLMEFVYAKLELAL